MKQLTYIQLGIFVAVFVNVTALLELPIFNVFRPVKEALTDMVREDNWKEHLETAIDIYTKSKQINDKVPKEEESLVESLMSLCRQNTNLYDILHQVNKCQPKDLKGSLALILEGINKGRAWIKN